MTVEVPAQTLMQGIASHRRIVWRELGPESVGQAVETADYADISVQMAGTWDEATVVLEGSNDDGASWSVLHDTLGMPLNFRATGLKRMGDFAHRIRPRVSIPGAGGCVVGVYALVKSGI